MNAVVHWFRGDGILHWMNFIVQGGYYVFGKSSACEAIFDGCTKNSIGEKTELPTDLWCLI
jgi:hypothetical protein